MKIIKLTVKELDSIIESAWEAGLDNSAYYSASDIFSRKKNQSKIVEVAQEEEV